MVPKRDVTTATVQRLHMRPDGSGVPFQCVQCGYAGHVHGVPIALVDGYLAMTTSIEKLPDGKRCGGVRLARATAWGDA